MKSNSPKSIHPATREALVLAGLFVLLTSIPARSADDEAGNKMSHPSHDGSPTEHFDSVYREDSDVLSGWSRGDITFEAHPPSASLSVEEKYIVAGCHHVRGGENLLLLPWHVQVFGAVARYYAQYNSIPDKLTPDVLRKIKGYEDRPDSQFAEFLNPLTDEWPHLKSASHSPGDIYLRPLSPGEMSFYSDMSPQYKALWYDGRYKDAGDGNSEKDAALISPVCYLRVYGWSGSLVNTFMYTWAGQRN